MCLLIDMEQRHLGNMTFITLAVATARVTDQLFKEFDNGIDKEDRRETEQNDEHGDCQIAIERGRLSRA